MNTSSPEINHLALALSKAQSAIEGAIEDSKNPFFKSNYADLSSVWSACKKPLTDNGLAVVHTTEIVEGKICLVTTLVHSSGQWMKGFLPLTLKENPTPQEMGSAITYARRYTLAAIACVCPAGEDDDAEKAMTTYRSPKSMPLSSSKKISQDQLERLERLVSDNKDLEQKILSYNKVASFEGLTESQFDSIVSRLEGKVKS